MFNISQREQYEKNSIGRWYWDFRDRKILKNIKPDQMKILDIGCGEGITLGKIIKQFPNKDILGLDVSPENIKICRNNNLPAVEADVYKLNIPSDSIDCCILIEVIEHLEDPQRAISEIKRVLKDKGQLTMLFPNDRFAKLIRLFFFKFREAFYDYGHFNRWNPKSMSRFLESSGFEVKKLENLPFYFWPISFNCLIIAEKNKN